MTWLAWRLFRTSAYVVLGFLVVISMVFALTGPHLAHVYDTLVRTCQQRADCNSVESSFTGRDKLLRDSATVLTFFPILLGLFWGAPLVARELESGTFRMVWAQGVTRRRWFLTRVSLVGAASVVATGILSLGVTWWFRPFDRIGGWPYNNFDSRDIAPIGYALFAVMVGICAGCLIRRVLPAMATTLAVFFGVRLFVSDLLRPRFEAAVRRVTPFRMLPHGGFARGVGIKRGDWVVSDVIATPKGQVVLRFGNIGFQVHHHTASFVGVGTCPNRFPTPPAHVAGQYSGATNHATTEAFRKCIASFHLREVVSYQPIGRYWVFQWYELAIFVVLSAAVGAFSYWWVRRRLA